MRKKAFLKMFAVSAAVMMISAVLPGCGKDKAEEVFPLEAEEEAAAEETDEKTEGPESEEPSGEEESMNEDATFAVIEVKDYGTIKIKLESAEAPITVQNFIDLAESGFYDGLTFHRIISGFMIQGGDPLGNGTGGADKEIKGEFSANGVENKISHVRGAISMARSNDPDSASSQFFIVHQDSTFLDGQYAGFGYVTEGMEVVDKICEDSDPVDDNGTIPKDAQPVIESIKIEK